MSVSTVGEPLALAHQAEVEAALAALAGSAPGPAEHAISDPTFANLYLFRRAHDYRFRRGEWPCIAGQTYDGTRHLLPLFDVERADPAGLHALLRGGECLYPLTQPQAAALDPDRFDCTASRDDADYLYPAAQFRHYRGTRLNKKRNLMKQLLAAHDVSAAPFTAADVDTARQVLAGWMKAKAKAAGEADEAPCTEALQLAPRLGLHGIIFRVDDVPAGFVLAEPIRPGVRVMRFAKGLDRFKGIYQFMFQHFCASLPDVHWLNFEQDMGLPNFRRSKLSYQPSALLPKFRAQLRNR